MKKIVSPEGSTHNKRKLMIISLCVFLSLTAVGTASAGISLAVSHKKAQLADAESELEISEKVAEEDLLKDPAPTNIPTSTSTVSILPKKVRAVSDPTITKFIAPLPKKYMGYKTSQQGLRESISAVDTGGNATSGKWHNGWDIACPDKTPVYATKDGYIFEVWPSYYNGPYKYKGHPAYGGLVVIKHPDSTISLYAHLSFTEVHEGDYVEAGSEIGWSGGVKGRRASGTSTGPHLHYSIYVDMDSFIDY